MAITPKPKSNGSASDAQIEAFIGKGMSIQTAADSASAPAGEKRMTLRIPAPIAAQMLAAIGARPVRTDMTTFILEAIVEKAARELGDAD